MYMYANIFNFVIYDLNLIVKRAKKPNRIILTLHAINSMVVLVKEVCMLNDDTDTGCSFKGKYWWKYFEMIFFQPYMWKIKFPNTVKSDYMTIFTKSVQILLKIHHLQMIRYSVFISKHALLLYRDICYSCNNAVTTTGIQI